MEIAISLYFIIKIVVYIAVNIKKLWNLNTNYFF